MYMARLVRYFCTVGPKGDLWSDVAYQYLVALVDSGITVRVLPLGGGMLSFPGKPYEHWRFRDDWFKGDLSPAFVNVVCAPPGQLQGQRITGRSVAPTRVVGMGGGEVPSHLLHQGHAASDDVVYEPAYSLIQLWTAGHRNIAITGATVATPSEEECSALRKYDAVICPTKVGAETLRLLDVMAYHYSAAELRLEANALPIFLGDLGE